MMRQGIYKITSAQTRPNLRVQGGQTQGATPIEYIDDRYWEEYGITRASSRVVGRVVLYTTPF